MNKRKNKKMKIAKTGMVTIKQLIFLIVILATGCVSKYKQFSISDVTKESSFILKHSDTTKNIFSVHIAFKGEINNNIIVTVRDGANYKKDYTIEKGNVDFYIDTDWYSTKCIINYKPIDVTQGKLLLEYKFFEL